MKFKRTLFRVAAISNQVQELHAYACAAQCATSHSQRQSLQAVCLCPQLSATSHQHCSIVHISVLFLQRSLTCPRGLGTQDTLRVMSLSSVKAIVCDVNGTMFSLAPLGERMQQVGLQKTDLQVQHI